MTSPRSASTTTTSTIRIWPSFWLKERGVLNPSIRISNYGGHTKFDLLARVRCASCKGALKYLDPRVHGIEAEQLACAGCGGMFELSSFK